MEIIIDVIDDYEDALWAGFIVSITLNILIFVFSQIVLLYDFNKRLLKIRVGKYKWDDKKENLKLNTACVYVGTHVSFSMISLLLTTTLMMIVFSFLFWKFTYFCIWEFRHLIFRLFYVSS